MEFKIIEPCFKKLLKELHQQGILYCYATEQDIQKAYNKINHIISWQ